MKTFILIITSFFLQLQVFANKTEKTPHKEVKITDNVSIEKNGYKLSLHLIPQSVLRVAPKSSSMPKLAEKAPQSSSTRTYTAKVGDLAFLVGTLTQNGQLVQNVRYTMIFHHIEDDKDIFSVSFISKNGKMNWGQQFFDGADHKITLKAEPLKAGDFKVITAKMNIGVIGIQPPKPVIIRSLLILLSVTALAMFIGYFLTSYFSSQKISLNNPILERENF